MMTWIITYAVCSTVVLSAAIGLERRLRVEWRETVLWLAIALPLLLATAGIFMPASADVIPMPLSPAIAVTLPQASGGELLQSREAFAAVLAVWIGVALLLLLLDFLRRRRLLSVLDRSEVPSVPLQELATRLGIGRKVRLTESAFLPVPIAIGGSEVCLPSHLLHEAAHGDLEPILLHELAHIRRRDPYLQLVARIIAASCWWQPLNRIVARRISAVAEMRTDALASSFISPTRLASALLTFAQLPRVPQFAGMPAFHSGLLNERIALLLAEPRRSSRSSTRIAISIGIAAVTVLLSPRFEILQREFVFAWEPLVVSPDLVLPNVEPPTTRIVPPEARSTAITVATIPQHEPTNAEVVAALGSLLRDPEKHVRAAARESLGKMKSPASHAALRDDQLIEQDRP